MIDSFFLHIFRSAIQIIHIFMLIKLNTCIILIEQQSSSKRAEIYKKHAKFKIIFFWLHAFHISFTNTYTTLKEKDVF